ncbi:MAG: 4'-phosphopantetheinyl transferase superfamily protein [Gemmataceae bacterium]
MRVTFRPFPEKLTPLTAEADAVHVWTAPLDPPPAAAAELHAVLSDAERARRDRFRLPAAGGQFAHTRGLLRHLLAAYTGVPPAGLRFDTTVDGKPYLVGGHIQFNVSHTAGLAAFVVAARPAGVDVERVREVASADGLVGRYFTPAEIERYHSLPEAARPTAFLRGWTCKEAVLKGVGCGTRGLERCQVEIDPGRPPRVYQAPDGGRWELTCWVPAAGFVGAVAVGEGKE